MAAAAAAAAVAAAEIAAIDTILGYIGSIVAIEQTCIAEDGFQSFNDLLTLQQSDVVSLSKGFSVRIRAQGMLNFGLC